MNAFAGWIVALTSGTVLWSIASLSLGGREPWDTPGYWTVWYPLALLVCAGLGFFVPEKPWRWPIAVMLIQLPVMLFISGGGVSLLPIGAILLLVLALPGMVTSAIGAALARRFRDLPGT